MTRNAFSSIEMARAAIDAGTNSRDPRPEPPPDELEAPPRRFKLLSVAEIHAMPPMRWLLHGGLPEQGTAAIFGPSGSAKGFIIVRLISAIAEGADFFGHRTRRARVIYVVLEGQAGVPNRVKAWEIDEGRPFPEGVQFVFESFRLTDPGDVLGLAATIESAGGAEVIVIDTLNRAAPGADENSSQDMGRLLEAVQKLQAMTGGLVLLVHHTGKDSMRGMRGHSSLHAALDAAIEVSRSDDRREWKVAKSKDGEDGQVHVFRLRQVQLGEDEDGEPVTSCVVDPDLSAEPSPGPRPQLPKSGGNQKIVYDALGPLFRAASSRGMGGAPAVRPCLTLDDAIDGVRDRLTCDAARRKERAQQAITGLVGKGVLGCNEGWIWLI